MTMSRLVTKRMISLMNRKPQLTRRSLVRMKIRKRLTRIKMGTAMMIKSKVKKKVKKMQMTNTVMMKKTVKRILQTSLSLQM